MDRFVKVSKEKLDDMTSGSYSELIFPGTWEYYFDDHEIGKVDCGWCFEDTYPQKCDCGGLQHFQIINSYDIDMRGYTDIFVRCDTCGKEIEL